MWVLGLAGSWGAVANVAAVEPDARQVPWATLRRLALESGRSLPPYRPLGREEILSLLRAAGPALADPDEREVAARLRGAYEDPAPLRAGLRLRLVHDGLGGIVAGETGLGVPPGSSVVAEPWVEWTDGRVWFAVAPRAAGRLAPGGRETPLPLLYDGWPVATWGPALGAARRDDGPWRVDWPRAAGGVRLGRWSLAAGRFAARTGPGESGGLLLDATAGAFPSLVLRRHAPFAWRGPLRPLAPSALLLRAGLLSGRDVAVATAWSPTRARRDHPWFLQWLLAWEPCRWATAGASLSALALPRSGALWPDLLQVAFPLLSATRNEVERGPLTDRLFGVSLEARWRRAPWPLLPAAAGRAYWEYAGEDFNPPGSVPLLPQISAPASVLGVELVGPRWDLAVEYVELEHPLVLWYAHAAFGDGYAHDGWPLGHPLGGGGESWQGEVRWRPPGTGRAFALRGARETRGPAGAPVGRVERWSWEATAGPASGLEAWRIVCAWSRERLVSDAGVTAVAEAWRVQLILGL